MPDTRLLAVRRERKRRKPTFIRQDANRYKKVGRNWNKPRGMHSKMRQSWGGRRRLVAVGFGGPSAVRHTSKEGLVVQHISSLAQLAPLHPQKDALIISAGVSKRKLIPLAQKATEQKFTIINFRDIAATVKDIKEEMTARKKNHSSLKARKLAASKPKAEKVTEKTAEKSTDKPTTVGAASTSTTSTTTAAGERGLGEKVIEQEKLLETQKQEEKKEKDKVLTKGGY